MKKLPLLALSLVVAAPAGAQAVATPVAVAPAVQDVPDAATTSLNSNVKAQLDAVAVQNQQAADAYAKQMATFEQARADFERAKQANDAERAAAAASASEYQKSFAVWRVQTRNKSSALVVANQQIPAAKDEITVTGRKRRVCVNAAPTGSMITVKRCRTVEQAAAEQVATDQTFEAMRSAARVSSGTPTPN